jgi:threonine dehydrogenase-like Zn-dependent dehydrogenase
MPGKVTCDTVDDPEIKSDHGIILKVPATVICSSNVHIYSGGIPEPRPMAMNL